MGLRNFIGLFSCGQLAAERAQGAGFYDLQAAVANPISLIEQWQVINTTTWSVSDTLTIKNIASYAEFTNEQRSPLFGTNWQTSTLPFPYPFVFFRGIPAIFTGIFPIPGAQHGGSVDVHRRTAIAGRLGGSALDLSSRRVLRVERSAERDRQSILDSWPAAPTWRRSIARDPIGSAFTAADRLSDPNVGAVNYTAGETTYRTRGLYAQSSFDIDRSVKLTGGRALHLG